MVVAIGVLGAWIIRLASVPPAPVMRVSVLAPEDVEVSREVPDLVIPPSEATKEVAP